MCFSTFLNAWVASVPRISRVTSKILTHASQHLHVVIILSCLTLCVCARARVFEIIQREGVEAGARVQGNNTTKDSTGRLIHTLIIFYFALMLCRGTKYDRNEMQIKFQPVPHFCMHNILESWILSLQDKREYIYVIYTLQSRISFHCHCLEQIAILLFISEPSVWNQCFLCLPPDNSFYFFLWWQHPESSAEYLS